MRSKMKNNVIKAAGIQIFCNTSKQGMLEKAEKYMEQAIQNYPDIDLFVLPEQFYQMDCYEYENEIYGEYEHGMFEEWLSQCAKKYHTNIIGGSYAVRPAKKRAENENIHEKVHNRCLVMNRNGERVGFYDKIHLFDAFGVKESDTFLSGSQLGLFQLDIGKVGVWICYDTRFPEIARTLRANGAEILCVPAAFYSPNADQWDIIVKASAICNVTQVVAVNQYGTLPNERSLFGRSRIVDAKGLIVAGMSDKEGYFVGEIDKEYTQKCRKENPEMENRRMDLYKTWYNE